VNPPLRPINIIIRKRDVKDVYAGRLKLDLCCQECLGSLDTEFILQNLFTQNYIFW